MILKTVFFQIYFQEVELVGLEAVSRGAKKAILCEKEKRAIEIIKKNIEKTHVEEKIELYQTSFEEFLKNKLEEMPNITFLDPPYNTDFAYQAIKIMEQKNFICENSIIIIETDQEERIKKELEKLNIEITDTRKYGRAYLIFLSKKRKG